jgi:hypothetical protein
MTVLKDDYPLIPAKVGIQHEHWVPAFAETSGDAVRR